MRDCNKCVHARPYGGENDNRCSAWACEFIDREEAIKAWREKHERKTEQTESECIPIEYIKDQIEEYRKFDHLGMYAEFLDMFIQDYKDNAMANYTDRKTEPREQFIVVKDGKPTVMYRQTEPQYEMGMGTIKCDNCSENGSYKCSKCDGEMYFKRLEPKTEPQTDCGWK